MGQIRFFKLGLAGILLLAASPAFSLSLGSVVLDPITSAFQLAAKSWGTQITQYATYLFFLLCTISMVWTFGLMLLRKADLGEFFAELIRFGVVNGFFLWLLNNGADFAISIVKSLEIIGNTAGGTSSQMGSVIVAMPIMLGLTIMSQFLPQFSSGSTTEHLPVMLLVLAVVTCLISVSANMIMAWVTAWVMAYAGIFILGFGGSRWTSDMAINYFKSMLSIGLEIMGMILLVGVATELLAIIVGLGAIALGTGTSITTPNSIAELFVAFAVFGVVAKIIERVPSRLAELVRGGIGGGMGGGMGGGLGMGADHIVGGLMQKGMNTMLSGTDGKGNPGTQPAGNGAQQTADAVGKGQLSSSQGTNGGALLGGVQPGGTSNNLAQAMGDLGTTAQGATPAQAGQIALAGDQTPSVGSKTASAQADASGDQMQNAGGTSAQNAKEGYKLASAQDGTQSGSDSSNNSSVKAEETQQKAVQDKLNGQIMGATSTQNPEQYQEFLNSHILAQNAQISKSDEVANFVNGKSGGDVRLG